MIKIRPINDAITNIRLRDEESLQDIIKSRRDSTERTIQRIEKNRLILPELLEAIRDMEGVDIPLYDWMNGSEITVDMGVRPSLPRKNKPLHERQEAFKARKAFSQNLIAIYRVLGKLQTGGKQVASGKNKLIRVMLNPVDYPGIHIEWVEKADKNDPTIKCKVVKRRVPARIEYDLVCEA